MTGNKKLQKRDKTRSAPKTKDDAGLIPSKPNPSKSAEYTYAPAPLMDLVFNFLQDFGYLDASHQIKIETQKREGTDGTTKPCSWMGAGKNAPALIKLWNESEAKNPSLLGSPASQAVEKRKADLASNASKQISKAGATKKAALDDIDTDDVTSSSEEESEDQSAAGAGVRKLQLPPEALTVPLPDSDKESTEDESESDESGGDSSSNDDVDDVAVVAAKANGPLKSDSSESEESSSDSDDESSGDEAKPATNTEPVANILKRKACDSSSENSSSDSSSGSEADSDDEPRNKKAKLGTVDDSSSSEEEESSRGSSSDDDTDEDMKDVADGDSEQTSTSDSEADSSSESSSSTTSGASDDDEESPTKKDETAGTKKAKINVPLPSSNGVLVKNPNGSESSVTLQATSPEFRPTTVARNSAENETDGAFKGRKKSNAPFQRVPSDIRIDPKFASNDYISYDYADRAHRDLSVVKGKGFTKEKNKKKRGSYKGGIIDTGAGRSIKFDD